MTQLSREDLRGMTPAEIMQARAEGRLDMILGRPVTLNQALDAVEAGRPSQARTDADSGQKGDSADQADDGQLSREDLQGMSPADISRAYREGRLNRLLGRS